MDLQLLLKVVEEDLREPLQALEMSHTEVDQEALKEHQDLLLVKDQIQVTLDLLQEAVLKEHLLPREVLTTRIVLQPNQAEATVLKEVRLEAQAQEATTDLSTEVQGLLQEAVLDLLDLLQEVQLDLLQGLHLDLLHEEVADKNRNL